MQQEALAIVFGVHKFHEYLNENKSTLLTDHPLTNIFGPHTQIPSLADSRKLEEGFVVVSTPLRHQAPQVRTALQHRWTFQVTTACGQAKVTPSGQSTR